MRYQIILLCSLISLALSGTYNNATRIVVISDNVGVYVSHSLFFDELRGQGYSLEFRSLNSPQMNLISYGEWQYDHMIIFASSQEEIKGLKVKELMEFFDNGNNIMILGSGDQSKLFRHAYNGFGFDQHEIGTQVFDHFNCLYQNDPTIVFTTNVFGQPVAPSVSKPILYKGAGLSLSPYETNQIFGFVRGSETAFSKQKNGDSSDVIVSSNVVYVGGMQGRNNARVVLTGSHDVFSNEFVSQRSYGNMELMQDLIRWNFGQSGILKQGELVHKRINASELKPANYKVSEDVYFSCEIFEWDYQNDKWVAYKANDVLLEFVMLDPYYRIPLKSGKGANFEIEFKLPDKYGVFQFKINYGKPGYSFLRIAEKVTVRPFRHDEYPRYLTQAFPYYLSSFATMAGFIVFVVFFLFSKE